MADEDSPTQADSTVYAESVRKLTAETILLSRYRLVRLLGQGGMGAVWLARDLKLNEDVAMKFLPEMVARDKLALEELKVEVRRSRRVTHPSIVRIHDYIEDIPRQEGGQAEWAGISMEYVEGQTLSELRALQPGRVFSAEELSPWVKELCAALDYAHTEAKMVHHDLKPANCMISAKGRLKLCDFGIARSLSESVTRLTTKERTSGTLIYMSPQQLMGEDPSALDDIYSLGAMLYELLSGKPPFYSGNIAAQVMEKTPSSMMERRKALGVQAGSPAVNNLEAPVVSKVEPPVLSEVEAIPHEWEETVAACLTKEKEKRPQSAGEVAERLGLASARSTFDARRGQAFLCL